MLAPPAPLLADQAEELFASENAVESERFLELLASVFDGQGGVPGGGGLDLRWHPADAGQRLLFSIELCDPLDTTIPIMVSFAANGRGLGRG
jgi:hypothetical protein